MTGANLSPFAATLPKKMTARMKTSLTLSRRATIIDLKRVSGGVLMIESGSLNKSSGEPIYSQIVNEVVKSIENRQLKYGAKLPTERELASVLAVSRGTVKKAYAELEKKGVISIVWGSGAYITGRGLHDDLDENEPLQELIEVFNKKQYAAEEAKLYTDIKIQKAFVSGKVNIAFVDNCPENLILCKQILDTMKNVFAGVFLYDDIRRFKNIGYLLSEYDMVLAGESCFAPLAQQVAGLDKKLTQVNLTVNKDTTISLLNILDTTKIGLLSKSRAFKEIVNAVLKKSGARITDKDHVLEKWTGIEEFNQFIQGKDYLILPPLNCLNIPIDVYNEIFRFVHNGGALITFYHGFDKSSLHYIEDKTAEILYSL